MEDDFVLSEKHHHYWDKEMENTSLGEEGEVYLSEDVKEFIKRLRQLVTDARMYADMDEEEFWQSSTISSKEAEIRAKALERFEIKMDELLGDKLK